MTKVMDTERALTLSLRKWEANTYARSLHGVRISVHDCPLCMIYNFSRGDNCRGCPVSKKSKQPYCRNTPYKAAQEAYNHWSTNKTNTARDAFCDAAEAEYQFLLSIAQDYINREPKK